MTSSIPRLLILALLLSLSAPSRAAELIPLSSGWRFFRGRAEASNPREAWRQSTFNDASWSFASAPFYYGEAVQGGTLLADMQHNYSTLYFRREFTLEDLDAVSRVLLDVRCDDGFAAWINGQLVASNNVSGNLAFNALASAGAPEPAETLSFDVRSRAPLRTGQNLLAIQVFNVSISSSDILFDAQLFSTEKEFVPPTLVNVSPFPGNVTNLSQVTVTFSEPVQGITASALRINDTPATGVTGSGSTYTFTFPQPAYGAVQFSWSIDAQITDLAVPPNPFAKSGANATFLFELIDPAFPFVVSTFPPDAATVRNLREVSINFNKVVEGLDASDLRVNGVPARSVVGIGAGPYVFQLPPLNDGLVSFAWAAGHGIHDTTEPVKPFAGGEWSCDLASTLSRPRVKINELCAANLSGLPDESGSSEDWIELFNEEETPINLQGWSLTDDPEEPGRWIFPAIVIPARGYLVLFASGKDLRGGSPLHTNFKLSASGEFLSLFAPDSPRAEVSSLSFPEQRNDYSWGLSPEGEWKYFAAPTPGFANSDSEINGLTEAVHFSVKRGYFSYPFDLTLHSPTPGAVIHYTLDGSEPALTSGHVYQDPIRIDRTRTVRAAAFAPGRIPSPTGTQTYLFNIPPVRARLPVLSLVTATNHLYGANGIMEYNPRNTTKHGLAWERPVSVEYLEPDGRGGFQIDCGIRVQGGDYIRERYNYRSTQLPESKYSYRLYFRGDYGAGKLKYPLIPDIPITSFDQISLRAGMNDPINPFLRDEFERSLSSDVGIVASHGTFVHLYLNGIYKGIYNPTERIGPDFLQTWHGGGLDWDVIAQSSQVSDGDGLAWGRLRSYIASSNPASRPVYEQIETMMDLQNFVDYLLPHLYADTDDWPHNNWRAARERTPGGRFRFYSWDAEFSFGFNNVPPSHNTITGQLSSLNPPWGTTEIQRIFNQLKLSPEFRLLFADRVHKHLFNGGALTDERIQEHYQRMKARLAPSISGFDDYIGRIWIPLRRRYLTNHLAAAGFLASSNAPVFSQFGGRVPPGFSLSMTAGTGEIWYTTDGSDPRVRFTGAVNAPARRYTGEVPILTPMGIKARTRWDGNWSALTEADFQPAQLGVPLRITEIMYNPLGGDAYEYLELQNIGGVPLSLANFSFEGINLRFGTDEPLLASGERILLASSLDLPAFQRRYPEAVVRATFTGSLSNGGERIAIKDAEGRTVTAVEYDDANGWPASADGAGYSLELLDPNGDPSAPANWKASAQPGGSPGAPNSSISFSSIRLNEVFAAGAPGTNPALAADWVELFNESNTEASLDGWSLSDDSDPRRFVFPPGSRIPARGFLLVGCDAPIAGQPLHTGFGLSQRGETLSLFDAGTNRIDAVTFGLQIAGHSIGRVATDESWALTAPTPLAPNESVHLSTNLVLNELLANSLPGEEDWLEIHNLDPQFAAAVGRCYLSLSNSLSRLPALSFIPAGGYLRLWADEKYGPDHLDFKLPASGGALVLADPTGEELNRWTYGPQAEGVAIGLIPDGDGVPTALPFSATPGAPNYLAEPGALRLNEILAHPISAQDPSGRIASWIELSNSSLEPILLDGFSVSLNRPRPGEWRFPPGSAVPAGNFLRVWCDADGPPDGLNTGLALNSNGSSVFLFDSADRLLDHVEFGSQPADYSIGLSPWGWTLLETPTPAASNAPPAALGERGSLTINEWMAAPIAGDDWIEIYNSDALPVDLAGLALTDDPSLFGRTNFTLNPLSFVGPRGYALLQADGELNKGSDHLPFKLDSFGETLRLYLGSILLDQVLLLPQETGVSEGRSPDGSANIVRFPGLATPHARNFVLSLDSDHDGLPDDWERAHALDPNDPSDAVLDSDGDGLSNLDEFRAGTDPNQPASTLRFEGMTSGVSGVELIFHAVEGRSYTVLSTPSLEAPAWSRVRDIAEGPAREIRFSETGGSRARFYRIVTPLQP